MKSIFKNCNLESSVFKECRISDLKFIDIIYDVKTIKLVRDECIKYLKEHKGEIENIYLKYDIEQKFSDIQVGN